MPVQYIYHKNVKILQIEFPDGMEKDKFLTLLQETNKVVAQNLMNSVLTLTLMGDIRFDSEMSKAFEVYVEKNKPYVKAAAVLGITGLKKVIYTAVVFLSHRNIKVFEEVEAAKDFLASQAQ